MRFFTFLPVVFCLGVQALPAAQTQKQTPSIELPTLPTETASLSTDLSRPTFDAAIPTLEKRERIAATIEKRLADLGLSFDSPIKALMDKLGLRAIENDLGRLLHGLVGEVDGVAGKVDDIVTDLLHDLGMEDGLDETICDVETALGLSHKYKVRKLLRSLHLI